jgi:beta-phosphoglucomutase family hydrolase
MFVIDVGRFEAFIFDLDGVITRTASVHARAWKKLFDELLARQAAQTGTPFVPFNLETDYHRYVDGKPRMAGVLSFLAARDINLPKGESRDPAEQETVHGLACRKDHYFLEVLAREGVQVFDSAIALVRDALVRGVRTAVASSSRNCAEILRAANLTALFDARVDGIDLDRFGLAGKPAPDMFLEVARRLGVLPAQIAVFEDATSGVEAARTGGFGLVVGIGQAGHATDLLKSGADYVVADLGEVRLEGQITSALKAH